MLGAHVQVVTNFTRLIKAVEQAKFRNFGHAAARIRKDAAASILPSDQPSAPGTPPHTRNRVSKKTGKRLKGQLERAIVYAADKDGAVVGPRESVVGTSASAHELGGSYKGEQFPKRPFMGPALEKNLDRFASDWAGSIGG